MIWRSALGTVRRRLLVAAIGIETLMLALMVGNSLRVLGSSLAAQAQAHVEQLTPVLQAALVTPLAQRDDATVQAILDESHSIQMIEYLAVSDSRGQVVASTGWPVERPLPTPDSQFTLDDKDGRYRYDVRSQIRLGNQMLGSLQFGIDLSQIVEARHTQFVQSLAIATGEIVLSAGLLAMIGLWLTRRLAWLTRVTEAVAEGDGHFPPADEGSDDIGRLGAAFNAMARTVRRKMEEQDSLRLRYELILQSAGEGIIGLDRDGQVTFVNHIAASLLGADRTTLVGRDFAGLIPAGEVDALAQPILEVCRGTAPARNGFLRLAERLAADYFIAPILENGQVVGAVLVLRDAALRLDYEWTVRNQREELARQVDERTADLLHQVNVRARAEAALLASQTRLAGITDSLVEGVVVIDRQGRVAFANPSARRLLRCEDCDDALDGLGLDELVLLRTADGPVSLLDAPPCDDDATLVLAGGNTLSASYSRTHAGGDNGDVILSFRDIGSLKQAQHEAMQSARLASIGQLAAGIAHEINTPIQYIGDNLRYVADTLNRFDRGLEAGNALAAAADRAGLAEATAAYHSVLAAEQLDEVRAELPDAVAESLDGVAQISRIVLSMKEFSHPGTTAKTSTDINRALDSTLMVSRNSWKHVAQVVTEFDPDLPPVLCHAGELNQVFLNLVLNAAHAIEDSGKPLPGRIHLSTRHDGDWVDIQVSDSGTGIPAAIVGHVFDPFFTTKPVGKGTGQGLAICRDVVTVKHGGTLSVEGRDGQGALFTIRLPVDGGSAASEEAAQ